MVDDAFRAIDTVIMGSRRLWLALLVTSDGVFVTLALWTFEVVMAD